MPPRKGIVKSGNAGNSSKNNQPPPAEDANPEKSLFPPGSKWPLNLLHERCRKNGWEKPIVDTRKIGDQFGFVVTLCYFNPKTSQTESVRLEPHPPYTRPTAIEARHWGATYALYRFCNGIQLNRVLPSGPREYWNELAAEHKAAPSHQSWMYESDPFAAHRAVKRRQEEAAKQRAASEAGTSKSAAQSQVSKEFINAPEVKMAASLRDTVEEAIRKTLALYTDEAASTTSVGESAAKTLTKRLQTLGFKPDQSQKAVAFISEPSSFANNFAETLTPLEASIEYLLLHTPEVDLPERFMPTNNSSNGFITGTRSGTDDLRRGWFEESMSKEGGWPLYLVREELVTAPSGIDHPEIVVSRLGIRLLGKAESLRGDAPALGDVDPVEIDAYGGTISPGRMAIPLPISPFTLHIFTPHDTLALVFPPAVHISSPSVPAYVRLHILSCILRAADEGRLTEGGESFVGACLRIIEEEWVNVEDDGPPDISQVLKHVNPHKCQDADVEVSDEAPFAKSSKKGQHSHKMDDRTDAQVKADFERICTDEHYQDIFSMRKRLPAFSVREEFLNTLERSNVVVVVGETGSGKTTQLPQFILDSLIINGQGSSASILVTQPRRLSAIAVAAHVSNERLSDGSVGYAIRGESKMTSKTKLLFCTTGVVLRRLSSGDKLDNVTHVVVDEVHERSMDSDFLLLELKDLLSRMKHLKVILMSATINQETFVKYFGGAPLISIPGRTFPVEDVYLEDIVPMLNYNPHGGKMQAGGQFKQQQEDLQSQGLSEENIQSIHRVMRTNRIHYELIAALVNHIMSTKAKGGILVFLPGVQEIKQCMQAIGTVVKKQVDILPLHANLSSDEQRKVFHTNPSKWKVVCSTNIAETSITIDDVVYIIDSGRMKEVQYDPETQLSRLIEGWVSKAAGQQRRGRAGRTQAGICYKTYTQKQERDMLDFSVPEILRVSLDNVCLSVKAAREDEDVQEFLGRAIDPPKVIALSSSWNLLKEIGAINEDNTITALGHAMAMLPVDVKLAKMMILGAIFRCLEPTLTAAACVSSKPLFLNPMDKHDEATACRAKFATAGSDLLTDIRAFDACAKIRSEGGSHSTLNTFCEENFISPSTVRDVAALRQDLFFNLAESGFVDVSAGISNPASNTHKYNTNLVKSVILGGLWPQVAEVRLPKSAIKFDQVAAGTVQRENSAAEFRVYDSNQERVFIHPTSVLFSEVAWKSPFVCYFTKHATKKTYLRDCTQAPIYAILLFGGTVSVNHVGGGMTVGKAIKLRALPRIGVLATQLRKLLDRELLDHLTQGSFVPQNSHVIRAMIDLITGDGLSS